jgi:hypothetical protein
MSNRFRIKPFGSTTSNSAKTELSAYLVVSVLAESKKDGSKMRMMEIPSIIFDQNRGNQIYSKDSRALFISEWAITYYEGFKLSRFVDIKN